MSIEQAFRRAGVPAGPAHTEALLASHAMLERGITSQARARDFLAQVLHESGRLRFFEEIASGAAYEGRRDLGNTHPGDGRRYKGRGPIQLTGRANYRLAGKALGLDLEGHPTAAARHDVGWRIAAWYWQTRGLNALADRNLFVAITQRINGGTNGLPDRMHLRSIVGRVDCRPADPLHVLAPSERKLVLELDALRAAHRDAPRRRVLVAALTARRKAIWTKAQRDGWDQENRRERWRILRARTSTR